MERNIDAMKYRKSTHLAGVDVEMIIAEKGDCILTIKDSYYNTNVDVSGNNTDGYFLEFEENVKPMVVNSINRKTISNSHVIVLTVLHLMIRKYRMAGRYSAFTHTLN